MFDLSGKMALVTGASGGIGGAIARGLHAQGAHVVLSGTREEVLSQLRHEPRRERASVAICDLADGAAVDGLGRLGRSRCQHGASTSWWPTPGSPRTD